MKNHAQRRWSILGGTTIVFATLALVPVRAEGPIGTSGGPQVPFKGCYYYEHASFKGERRDIPQGLRRQFVGDHWNDKISSIACASGCSLRVWEHRDFKGATKIFNGNTLYVGDAWDDDISSLQPICR